MTDEYKIQARTAIHTLVLEEIIGEDETYTTPTVGSEWHQLGRNSLKAEQRKKLGGTHGTK